MSVAGEAGAETSAFLLQQNASNPAVGTTAIRHTLAEAPDVRVDVYNVIGRRVATLVDGFQADGLHVATWNAVAVANGTYVYRVTAGGVSETRRLVVAR